ncbi:MAG: sugar ABC transporter permease [Ignavibacteriae bacterium]|nr:sugar ABC transporter permease [Ignavibacteriota bacterium]MCB9214481.1 sugar ABC transporter permease [Ignavibacteria bacterium]
MIVSDSKPKQVKQTVNRPRLLQRKPKQSRSFLLEKKGITWLFLSPWLITLLLFWIYPLLYSLYMSFTEYRTLSGQMKWIGLANYERLVSDPIFWKALANTLIFVVGTIPFTTIFAIVLAVMLSRNIAWKGFYRSAFFIPSVTALVVLALIFTNLYAQDGYINSILNLLNIPYPKDGWLLNTGTALLSIMAMDVWIATGYYTVLFLAALQTIPNELYEAAEIDGASRRQQFFRVTLPGLRPMLLFVIVLNTIRSFQVFTEVYVMTKGGPLNATTTLVYEVYRNAFDRSDLMGYASAIAYVTFILILGVSLLQMRFLREGK